MLHVARHACNGRNRSFNLLKAKTAHILANVHEDWMHMCTLILWHLFKAILVFLQLPTLKERDELCSERSPIDLNNFADGFRNIDDTAAEFRSVDLVVDNRKVLQDARLVKCTLQVNAGKLGNG